MTAIPRKMRVLVTGASGRIGRAFREGYRSFYSLKLTYHRSPIQSSAEEEAVPTDITDLDSVLKAMEGVEAVVHLAADPNPKAPWNSILKLNLVGTYNIFEAARRSSVKRVVFASSNHACGFSVLESDLVGPDLPTRPDSLYGVSKVFGEALGRYYSDSFGLTVICLRIGWSPGLQDPGNLFSKVLSEEKTRASDALKGEQRKTRGDLYPAEKLIAMWISDRDIAQVIHRSLEADLKFGIFYATSNNTPAIFDLNETRRILGYEPQDRAEDYLR